eukprot:NODE_1976_length_1019_cov_95.685567_g1606_i0.p1 GENE.NODE_1976_length_1019_cov_95.685567_g1606_i0~~NODE_1976_length_1019_cov_95.685567_g1606_i0.p1  ORF type:complete len:322 (-),score=58.59 NODE_1976_length_1019_cov_95.685567_g1606_i0:52-984(-)
MGKEEAKTLPNEGLGGGLWSHVRMLAIMLLVVTVSMGHGHLVAHWPLNGSAFDYGSHHAHGSTLHGVSYVHSARFHQPTACLDGTPQALVSLPSLPLHKPMSIAMYFLGTPTRGSALFTWGAPRPQLAAAELRVTKEGFIQYGEGDHWHAITSTVGVGDARWHHVVLVADGAVAVVYIDGKVSGTGPMLRNPKISLAAIGARAYQGLFDFNMKGCIFDLRLYNHSLRIGDIKELIRAYPDETDLDAPVDHSRRGFYNQLITASPVALLLVVVLCYLLLPQWDSESYAHPLARRTSWPINLSKQRRNSLHV